jgi:hypothetical protein
MNQYSMETNFPEQGAVGVTGLWHESAKISRRHAILALAQLRAYR